MVDKIKRIEMNLNAYKAGIVNDRQLLAIIAALEEAIGAGKSGNYPCGSVVTDSQFSILSRGRNSVFKPSFHSDAHAEMAAITALENSQCNIENLILITTVEPCLMCMTRIFFSKITQVIYVQPDPTTSMQKIRDLLPSNLNQLSQRVKVVQYDGDSELIAISRELYQVGEDLWSILYGL